MISDKRPEGRTESSHAPELQSDLGSPPGSQSASPGPGEEVEIREACFELRTVHSTPFRYLKRVECTVLSSKQASRISVNNRYVSGNQLAGSAEPLGVHAPRMWFCAVNKPLPLQIRHPGHRSDPEQEVLTDCDPGKRRGISEVGCDADALGDEGLCRRRFC